MTGSSLQTAQLHQWLDGMRAGEAAARDALFRHISGRLERMARRMLRGFPAVARWEDTADVMQRAVMRLMRALEAVRPDSVAEFFGLAAEQLRRTLLDLARHYRGPCGLGANHASHPPERPDGQAAGPVEAAPDRADRAANLDRWTEFHEAAAGLPEAERQAFGLVFYHGLTQPEAAELLGVSERTVRRNWHSACHTLREALAGRFPEA